MGGACRPERRVAGRVLWVNALKLPAVVRRISYGLAIVKIELLQKTNTEKTECLSPFLVE